MHVTVRRNCFTGLPTPDCYTLYLQRPHFACNVALLIPLWVEASAPWLPPQAFEDGMTQEDIKEYTQMDPWFIAQMWELHQVPRRSPSASWARSASFPPDCHQLRLTAVGCVPIELQQGIKAR